MHKDSKADSKIIYRVSPSVTNDELNELFASAWGRDELKDFFPVLDRSLLFVCAYQETRLVGFVNVAWDGGVHAFILDTTVHKNFQRRGIGLRLVNEAEIETRNRGVHWLHVDFEPHLQTFYSKCGFRNTNAGLINLIIE